MKVLQKNGFFMTELLVAIWILSFVLLGICAIYVNIAKTKIKIEKEIRELEVCNKGEFQKNDNFDKV